jgi:hypothetical protein
MAATFTARSAGMMDGDEGQQRRRRKLPAGLRGVKFHLGIENENIEEHQREDGHAKVTRIEPHHELVDRVDTYDSVDALAIVQATLPRKKWLAFVACEFGMVEDNRGILRVHPALIPAILDGKERDLSYEEIGRRYDLAPDSVKQYYREARRAYQVAYDAVMHTPKRSYWWGEEYGEMDAGRPAITRNQQEAPPVSPVFARKRRE